MKATERVAASRLAQETAGVLQGVHQEVPAPKLAQMWARTILGLAIGLVAGVILVVLVVVPVWIAWRQQSLAELSAPIVLIGLGVSVGLFVWAALTVSGQLAGTPLKTTVATFAGVWRTVRGKGGTA